MSEADNPVLEKPKPRNPGWANIKPPKKGEVRNPQGRGIGSRNKLADAFIADVYEAWQVRGAEAVEETIKRKPWEFVKIVSGLMPQKLEITNKFQNMADDELSSVLARAARDITPLIEGRASPRPIGYEACPVEADAESISTVPETERLPRGGSKAS
jgi:hypothetical protein